MKQMRNGIVRAGRRIKAEVSPVQHPLGPPVVSGTAITVESALQQPTRITRMIMDLTLQRFIADRVFTSAGGVTGGAVIYDEVQENELYAARDVEEVAPGQEVPLITSERLVPKVEAVRKWGGRTYVTDEARDRNDVARFTRHIRQIANTIVRKMNAIAVDKLQTAVDANGRTVAGRDWTAVVVGGAGQTDAKNWPARDFAHAARIAEEDELGVSYNLWLLNPQEFEALVITYGAANLPALLSALNISIFVSNRVTAGTAYVVAEGQVGQMRVEKPLGTATWRTEGNERTDVQSTVRPLMFVDNPFAVLQFTGLAGEPDD